jgi:hypothetical protein
VNPHHEFLHRSIGFASQAASHHLQQSRAFHARLKPAEIGMHRAQSPHHFVELSAIQILGSHAEQCIRSLSLMNRGKAATVRRAA